MARAIWSGSVSFGLVNVPVKAYAAVRDHTVHFNQLEKGTGARIHYKKVSDKTGKELSADDIESGYEVSPGKYVVIEDEEFERLRPRTTRSIDINDFVDLDEVDPIYYERTYWLAPDGEAAERAYRLLTAAMESEGKVGIGSVVMRNKQYLAAIRPLDGAMAMSTMRFADEVVPQSEVDALPSGSSGKAEPEAKELKLASQIIESLATEWDPARYHDTYTEQLREVIDAKAKGKEIVVEEDEQPEAKVIDLMQALEASLAAARKGGGAKLTAEVAKVAEQLAEESEDEETDEDDKGDGRPGGGKAKSGAKKAASKSRAPSKSPAKKSPAKKSAAKKKAAGRKSAAKAGTARRKSA